MTKPVHSRQVLAVRREKTVVIYEKFMDRATSGWRYRAAALFDPAKGTYRDYTVFRSRNSADVDASIASLLDLEKDMPGLSLLSLAQCRTGSQRDTDNINLLVLYADFFRFFQVNRMIAAAHFLKPMTQPFAFRSIVPVYNLIVALDLHDLAQRAIQVDAPLLFEAARSGVLREDINLNGSGTFRALADFYNRLDLPAQELAALETSQKLSANPRRAARIEALGQVLGKNGSRRELGPESGQENLDARLAKLRTNAQTRH